MSEGRARLAEDRRGGGSRRVRAQGNGERDGRSERTVLARQRIGVNCKPGIPERLVKSSPPTCGPAFWKGSRGL